MFLSLSLCVYQEEEAGVGAAMTMTIANAAMMIGRLLLLLLLLLKGGYTATAKTAPPSFTDEALVGNTSVAGESMLKRGVSVAEAAAREEALRAGTRVLGIVAKGVKAEEVYGTVLAGMRERGFQVTLATAEDKINMPLEEYGHVLFLSNCT